GAAEAALTVDSARDLQHQFAEVLAAEELEQGGREIVDGAFDDILTGLESTLADPARHGSSGFRIAVQEVEDDETLHAGPVDQQRKVVVWAGSRFRGIVLGDGAAYGHAGMQRETGQGRVQNRPAHVVE